MQVYLRDESENGPPQRYLDATEVYAADPTWPATGTVSTAQVPVPGRPYSIFIVSQAPQSGDTPVAVREETESGAPLPAWNITGLTDLAWPAHGVGLNAFLNMGTHEVLVIVPNAPPPP